MSQLNGPGRRVHHLMEWTGSEVLVWGGTNADGFAWSPVSNAWRQLPTMNQPAGYQRPGGTWTGSEFVVWGGYSSTYQNTGARYDPVTNVWRPMSTVQAPSARWSARLAWTGSEVMVFGGYGTLPDAGVGELNDGALYDPALDTWRALPTGAPAIGGATPTLLPIGNEVLVFSTCAQAGARLSLTSNQWLPMSMTNSPNSCGSSQPPVVSVWTGQELLSVGGPVGSGARYSPTTDTWSPLPAGPPCQSTYQTGVWTGRELLVWGGVRYTCPSNPPRVGYRFRPGTNTWVPMTALGQPTWEESSSSVWTGSELVLLGGGFSSAGGSTVSGRYRP